MSYPLLRQLAIGAALLMLVDTFADYAIKAELAARYDREGIGTFMGPFYGISSLLTLASQFGLTDTLTRSFGVTGLLFPLPALCLVGASMLAAWPSLWPAAALRLGQNVARYGVDNLGREIAARPLPSSIRRAGKLYLKGVATPVGAGLAGVLLWLLAERIGLRGVAAITVISCAGWVMVTTRTAHAYQHALREAVGAGRLSVSVDEVSEAALHEGFSVARHALSGDDPEAKLFGLQLLEQVGHGPMPAWASNQLQCGEPTVRAAAAAAASSFDAESTVTLLLQRLEVEDDAEVTWRLLETLATVRPAAAIDAARELIKHGQPRVRAGAILVLLAAGDLDGVIRAALALREMIGSDDPTARVSAANAIGALNAGRLERELRVLIDDTNEEVVIAAMRAAAERRASGLVDEIAAKLGAGSVSYFAGRALVAIGDEALPTLVKVIVAGKPASCVRAAVRVIASVPGPAAERTLYDLVDDADGMTRLLLAKEAASRARREPPSDEALQKARLQVEREAQMLRALARVLQSSDLPGGLGVELKARRTLAARRLLSWFAACTRPAEVSEVIPAVLHRGGNAARRATALELLDSLADRQLRGALAALEEEGKQGGSMAPALAAVDDPWIKWLVQELAGAEGVGETPTMDVAQKVMLLRKVNLFASLPGEVLVTIAETCESQEFADGERIFAAGDNPDGLYMIASGQVEIRRKDKVLVSLATGEFFGEVALLDDDPRMADAVAITDGMALYMDREVFARITEDLPEVLRAVTRTLIQYLKHAEAASGRQTLF